MTFLQPLLVLVVALATRKSGDSPVLRFAITATGIVLEIRG